MADKNETAVAAEAKPIKIDKDIEKAYPESYTEDEQHIGEAICDYLNTVMGDYTRPELTGVVKFTYDFFGVAIDFGLEGHPGWCVVTRDIAYDCLASDKEDAKADSIEE